MITITIMLTFGISNFDHKKQIEKLGKFLDLDSIIYSYEDDKEIYVLIKKDGNRLMLKTDCKSNSNFLKIE